ncbi:hypothetical protein [Phenylobacterium sp.]|uniref:hypothetical protein n=1 Tax=Phenylobacterium sp. TaxID=1871053 RepID=UPI0025FDACAE|nr:hypothetical protein [Phenylobacterium sp.]
MAKLLAGRNRTMTPCGARPPSLKPREQIPGGSMAIAVIAVFLIVIAALNRFEFGRFD